MINIIWYAVISFIVTFIAAPIMISYLKKIGLNVRDYGKFHEKFIPISGGLIVLIGLFVSLIVYIFIATFIDQNITTLTTVLAALLSILLVTIIGFMDDLLVKYSGGDEYIGLKRWQKPLLVLPAAIPLMAIKAGTATMSVPFIGSVDFGLLYPLLLVPLGFLGASNMVNMLEGFNGIAAGMGIFYSLSLGFHAWVNARPEAAILSFALFGALLAFLRYNFVPAKVLPGDSLTYLLGASIATIAIIGNMEKAALVISIPFMIEFFLKLRGKMQKQTYGLATEDGKIQSRYKKIYSLPHLLTRTGKYTEKHVVLFMMGISLTFSVLIWVI